MLTDFTLWPSELSSTEVRSLFVECRYPSGYVIRPEDSNIGFYGEASVKKHPEPSCFVGGVASGITINCLEPASVTVFMISVVCATLNPFCLKSCDFLVKF